MRDFAIVIWHILPPFFIAIINFVSVAILPYIETKGKIIMVYLISYNASQVTIEEVQSIFVKQNDRFAIPFGGALIIKTNDSFKSVLKRGTKFKFEFLITPTEQSSLDGLTDCWDTIRASVF
ncbi:hypothetical protein [Weissella thailandensis]|uniref:hypothetical protein n=1 Tax=Weissella thailandensis TaxID=89061 RepID=UPI0010591D3A|nr:hypothetical protein [Weissella thailandensis]NKY90337.1 hypothetical protein [Weissella thailandensis]